MNSLGVLSIEEHTFLEIEIKKEKFYVSFFENIITPVVKHVCKELKLCQF